MSDNIVRGIEKLHNDVGKIKENDQSPEEKSKSNLSKLRRAFSMPRNTFNHLSKTLKSRDPANTVQPAPLTAGPGIVADNNSDRNDVKNLKNGKKIFRRSSFTKFLTRIAQQMTSVNISSNQSKSERINSYVWPPDTTPGVIGLKNHGNTCFMNSVLQCLSHTNLLAEYFVLDQYKVDLKRRNKINAKKFGTKGELTEQLALVLKALWTCKDAPEYSTSFKAVVDRYGTQFRSSTQHDAQEFLFWLLDKVHEDLNTAPKRRYKSVKNNYGRSDEVIAAETLANHIRCNNSFVQAVFQAQFRSSLSCPICHKQSNTFDPFHCISVQLPQLTQQAVFVKVLYASQQPKQVKLGLGIPHGSPMIVLREQLQADTGISNERIVLAEISDTGFSRVFCDSHTIESVCETDPIYCIESPEIKNNTTEIILIVANVERQTNDDNVKRFGTPFCILVNRDISYSELQKLLLKEMSTILKPEIFTYSTPINEMFKIRLQDPSADPDTYIDPSVEHPLFTEMIDLALSIIPNDAGPIHIKLLLEWREPNNYFSDLSDSFVEHESVSQLKEKLLPNNPLTLEQCLDHYTKAETLSTEDAWRCPNCQQYLPVVKTLGLWSLPEILVIHFKRFRQQQIKTQAAKLTTMVKFPLYNFDMTPHLARSSNSNVPGGGGVRSKTIEENGLSPNKKNINNISNNNKRNTLPTSDQMDNKYDLYAVCYHQGDTLETGHYTAACKNPYDQQWYRFDDQRVSQVPNDDIPEQIVNNEAYILFYQRRKIDNAECSGTTSTSSGEHWVSRIAATAPFTNSVNSSKSNNINAKLPADSNKLDTNEIVKIEIGDVVTTEPIVGSVIIEESIETVNENEIVIEDKNTKLKKEPADLVVDDMKKISDSDEDLVKKENISVEISTPADEVAETVNATHQNEEKISRDQEENEKLEENVEIKPMADKKEIINVPMNSRQPSIHELFWNDKSLVTTFSNFKKMECGNETISMIRGASSCSKDTLLYIDQQNSGLLNDDDEDILGSSRALWISPLTPHKLITVSPKN